MNNNFKIKKFNLNNYLKFKFQNKKFKFNNYQIKIKFNKIKCSHQGIFIK